MNLTCSCKSIYRRPTVINLITIFEVATYLDLQETDHSVSISTNKWPYFAEILTDKTWKRFSMRALRSNVVAILFLNTIFYPQKSSWPSASPPFHNTARRSTPAHICMKHGAVNPFWEMQLSFPLLAWYILSTSVCTEDEIVGASGKSDLWLNDFEQISMEQHKTIAFKTFACFYERFSEIRCFPY